jgi:hypothetical protein
MRKSTSSAHVWQNPVDVPLLCRAENTMSTEMTAIADSLARYFRTLAGVSEVRDPVFASPPPTKRRLPVPSLKSKKGAAFEISFVYKGEPRTFRYYFDGKDDLRSAGGILRAHSNGELMVRVPDDYGHVVPNDIYYVNRIAGAPGSLAPRS